jgi:hypothetical protein
MSNWFDPDCALAAIATARPATDTGSAVDAPPAVVDPATLDGVAATKAVKPRFGTPPASAFAVPVPFCVTAVCADVVETSVARALLWSAFANAAASFGLDAAGFVSLACVWAWGCWMTLLAICVLPFVKAEADACLSSLLSVVAGADAWFAGAVSLVSGVGVASCAVTVAVADLVCRLVASPITGVAALRLLIGVGGLTGGATVIAAATGCGALVAALCVAAAAGSAVVVALSLPLSSLLLSLGDAFAGAAGAALMSSVESAGGTPVVVAPLAEESALLGIVAALALAVASLRAWGPVLPPVDVRGATFPPVDAAGLGAPSCAAAGAVLLIGVAAGFVFGLAVDGWEEAWPGGELPALFGVGLVAPLFVAPLFADPVFVGAGFVGAEFVDGEVVGPEFADVALVGP